MTQKDVPTFYLFLLVFFAALGGFLFGFTTGVISGALGFIAKDFSLTVFQEGVLVSIILIGALVGSYFAGIIADYFGRRKAILLTALIFILGIWMSMSAETFWILLSGRGVTGLAVGIISVAAPLYLSEIAPSHFRGGVVAAHQLAITIGILFAYSINYLLSASGNWRLMFGWGIVPAAIQFIGMLFLPETPAWLLEHGHINQAKKVLSKLRKDIEWKKHFPAMKAVSASSKKVSWHALFKPHFRTVFLVGIVLSAFQQITGINTVMYYAPKIFQIAGFPSVSSALFATFGIGIINVLATFFSVWFLDRIGRRKLLLIGSAGMVIALSFLVWALASHFLFVNKIALMSLMGYVAFFGIGLGPVTWVVLSEIYPSHIRARAMGIATFLNWLCNYIITLIFLDLMRLLTPSGTFALFTGISLICFWFIYRFIPETKGKSLEQIEELFR